MPGKIVLITGASRGIGAATALLAAEQGYQVCVNYKTDSDAANRVVKQIEQRGGKARAFQADVADEESVIALFTQIDRFLGPIHALVNNAATLEKQLRLKDMDAARMQRIFSTNVLGSFLCAREAVKRMSTQSGGKGGVIVNVSSIAAKIGSPGEYVDYAASKGAIDTMTLGLSKEVAAEGIRVNAVRPGIIYTDIHARGGEAGRVDRLKTQIPMQRGGQPEEVARAILWLLSEDASYTTGAILDVSGGR